MTAERSEFLKSFDGTDIFFRCFTPKKTEKDGAKIDGLVLAVHGFGEHSGRYAHVAEAVCSRNLAFACFDLRGHGKSGPRKGDAENLHALVLDVLFVINHARSILGLSLTTNEFFGILGHSFGGLLVTYAAAILNESCPPIFLSSPCYRVSQTVPAWKMFAARALPRVAPKLQVPVEIIPEFISENPENNQAYINDELNMFSISTRLGKIFLDSQDDSTIRNAATLVKAPVTVAHGAIDKLVDSQKTREIFPLFSASRSSLTPVEGAGHEIFNELEPARTVALNLLLKWIDNKGYAK